MTAVSVLAVLVGSGAAARPGLSSLLAAAAAVAGCGFFVLTAVEWVMRRLDRLEAKVDDRRSRRPARRVGHLYASESATVGIARPVDADTDVTRLPAPEVLRAARSLASKVIASERQRSEDNPEDTTTMRM